MSAVPSSIVRNRRSQVRILSGALGSLPTLSASSHPLLRLFTGLVGERFLHLFVRSLVAEVGEQDEVEQLGKEAAELAGVPCGHLLVDARGGAAGDNSGQVPWES